MALAPRFRGALLATGAVTQRHTLELCKYLGAEVSGLQNLLTGPLDLDYVCPFSARIFDTIFTKVVPLLNEKYPDKVHIIFRQQVQPWHPSSSLVHEAALAVLQISPQQYWAFSAALFKTQNDFMDVNVVEETRNETYARLAKIAKDVGVDESLVYEKLKVPDRPGPNGFLNTGNAVTTDLKQVIKYGRTVGVHVSPTVFFNGLEERSVSSGWTLEEWSDWLEKNVV